MLGIVLKDDDLVFSDLEGKPLLPDTVTHAWIKLMRRTRLKGIRLHDARHTHASLMLKHRVHPKVVQERLGHSSISTTLDIYSHEVPGLQAEAARKFDEGFPCLRYPTRSPHVGKMLPKTRIAPGHSTFRGRFCIWDMAGAGGFEPPTTGFGDSR